MDEKIECSAEVEIPREEWETDFRVKRKSWLRFKHLLWFLVVLMGCLVIATPAVLKRQKQMNMSHALSNMKAVYLLMMDFEADMGNFPDEVTAMLSPELRQFRGDYSNRYLGQLIAGGYTKSEEIFYAFDKRYGKMRADDVISPPSRILAKGECGFSYVMVEEKGARRGLSTEDDGGIPVLVAPLLNEWGSCEKKSYDDRGIYLRVDGSARSKRLNLSDLKINVGGGKTLFDSGPRTVWGNLKPVVLLPER